MLLHEVHKQVETVDQICADHKTVIVAIDIVTTQDRIELAPNGRALDDLIGAEHERRSEAESPLASERVFTQEPANLKELFVAQRDPRVAGVVSTHEDASPLKQFRPKLIHAKKRQNTLLGVKTELLVDNSCNLVGLSYPVVPIIATHDNVTVAAMHLGAGRNTYRNHNLPVNLNIVREEQVRGIQLAGVVGEIADFLLEASDSGRIEASKGPVVVNAKQHHPAIAIEKRTCRLPEASGQAAGSRLEFDLRPFAAAELLPNLFG
jgi:hypothetical protein